MSIRAKLEERERIRAKKLRKVATQLKIMKTCVARAKDENLPSAPFMEAALILITGLTKAELP